MPSFSRSNNMPTVIHSKDSSPRRDVRVGFLPEPVTGVLRPVNATESWAAYNFEHHARKCAYCHNPYEVHRAHDRLCEVGHRLAQSVASYIYNNADGETYSTEKEDHKLVRVELPTDFDQVHGLLRAIERNIRHRSRRPFVSMDRTYYVAARLPLPERTRSVKAAQPPKPVKVHRPRNGEVVDWPAAAQKAKGPTPVTEISNSKRGSLYASDSEQTRPKRGSLYVSDMEQQRRDLPRYNVEVREPSKRDIREHRLSGYYS